MTPSSLTPLPGGTHLLHVATWASDAAAVDAALAARTEDLPGISSLHPASHASRVAPAGEQGERHALLALRAPERTLARGWLCDVEHGGRFTYDEWLSAALRSAGAAPPAIDPRPLIEELADVHGPSNVTVSATVDDALMTPIEQLLGLPDGNLAEVDRPTTRLLTVGEAEMIRAVNATFAAQHWPDDVRRRYVATIATDLKRHGATSDRATPALPTWARVRLQEIHDGTRELVSALRVRVCGDLDAFAPGPDDDAAYPGVRPAVAARAVAAAIVESGVTELRGQEVAGLSRVGDASVRQVLGEIGRRLRGRGRTT